MVGALLRQQEGKELGGGGGGGEAGEWGEGEGRKEGRRGWGKRKISNSIFKQKTAVDQSARIKAWIRKFFLSEMFINLWSVRENKFRQIFSEQIVRENKFPQNFPKSTFAKI